MVFEINYLIKGIDIYLGLKYNAPFSSDICGFKYFNGKPYKLNLSIKRKPA